MRSTKDGRSCSAAAAEQATLWADYRDCGVLNLTISDHSGGVQAWWSKFISPGVNLRTPLLIRSLLSSNPFAQRPSRRKGRGSLAPCLARVCVLEPRSARVNRLWAAFDLALGRVRDQHPSAFCVV